MNHFPGHFRLNPVSAKPQQQKRTQPPHSNLQLQISHEIPQNLEANKSQTTTFKATYTYGTDTGNTVQQSCSIPAGATSHTITITHNFGFATGAPNAQSMDGSHALAVARQN
jgi:hypothetical protein